MPLGGYRGYFALTCAQLHCACVLLVLDAAKTIADDYDHISLLIDNLNGVVTLLSPPLLQ